MDVPVHADEVNSGSQVNCRSSSSPSGNQSSRSSDGESPHALCLSASTTTMETIKFQHRWTIDQFSVQQELSQIGESVESRFVDINSPFGSKDEDHKFRLKLFPVGKDEDCRGYLSLFLQIQKCPQSNLRFRVNFYLVTTEGSRGCALNRNVVIINKGGIVTASKFFSMDTLKRAAVYVPNDVLTVGVDLTVFGEQTSKELDTRSILDSKDQMGELGTLVSDLSQFYADMSQTDCVLRVGPQSIPAHTAMLQARSPVFNAMFAHWTVERENREVEIDDCTPEAISALVEFIYTDKYSHLETLAGDVLAAADKYGVLRLKLLCERDLSTDLSTDNVCERLRIADSYSAALLRTKALTIIEQHKAHIMCSAEWSELERSCPMLAAVVLRELMSKDAVSNTIATTKIPASSTPASAQSSSNVLLIKPQPCSHCTTSSDKSQCHNTSSSSVHNHLHNLSLTPAQRSRLMQPVTQEQPSVVPFVPPGFGSIGHKRRSPDPPSKDMTLKKRRH